MSYSLLKDFGRRIRWGMVGGGLDSIIGETHRLCARLDNRFDLVAGAMLSIRTSPAKQRKSVCSIRIAVTLISGRWPSRRLRGTTASRW